MNADGATDHCVPGFPVVPHVSGHLVVLGIGINPLHRLYLHRTTQTQKINWVCIMFLVRLKIMFFV